jgi:hypothetical protein
MGWLTWRQHRMQVLVTAALIVGVGVLLLFDKVPIDLVKTLPWTPALVGLFWGVPLLVKEYERGTHSLAWTQSVRRFRWLAVKFGALSVAVVLAGLAVGALMTRWSEGRMDRFSGDLFGVTGVAPAAWFLAVFALGAASGAVLRRMLPAMAVTIGVFAVLVVGAFLGRAYYAEPVLAVQNENGIQVPAGALVMDTLVRSPSGDWVNWDDAWTVCQVEDPVRCMEERGYGPQATRYQPAARYWRFQWTETGLLLALTVALAGVTAYRVVRRPL